MSGELERLVQMLRTEPRLAGDLRRLIHDPDAALQWAADRGIHLTREDLDELRESDRELPDDDLDQVAGGDSAWGTGTPPPPGTGTPGSGGG